MRTVQQTLAREAALDGAGLHTGAPCRVTLRPAEPGSGVVFRRADLDDTVALTVADVRADSGPGRTTLERAGVAVQTVEHLLAALYGLGLENVEVLVDGPELPGGDGSAAPFAEALLAAGFAEQAAPRLAYRVTGPLLVSQANASLAAVPAPPGEFRLTYSLYYRESSLARGYRSLLVTPESFAAELAPARTFCMAGEVETLLRLGLGRGANTRNTLVLEADAPRENTLRFPDEPVRHKLLDLLGDLALLGAPLFGQVLGCRSGHGLNRALVRRLLRAGRPVPVAELLADSAGPPPPSPGLPPPEALDAAGVMELLPHRYPFLLVDRVVELREGHSCVAIKNLTRSEPYFRGHFPGRPVGPGVLQIEALAQTAGILLGRLEILRNRVGLLASVEKMRLRRPLLPGDRMVITVGLERLRGPFAVVTGKIEVDGEVAAEGQLRFAAVETELLSTRAPAAPPGPPAEAADTTAR